MNVPICLPYEQRPYAEREEAGERGEGGGRESESERERESDY
jgi:hypothetical protein